MSKAEEKSIEWQKAHNPMAIGGGNFADVVDAYNVNPAFVAGYKQAEKDLALTNEDIASIVRIMFDCHMETGSFNLTDEALCKEVLKRFNAQREK